MNEVELLTNLSNIIRKLKIDDHVTIISLIGGAASGKSTMARKLKDFLGDANILGTDDYLVGDRSFRRKHLEGGDPREKYNQKKLNTHIEKICHLKEGEQFFIPTYDEVTGEAVDATKYNKAVGKAKYLIIEGDFDFVEKPDYRIYLDVSDQTRLSNRLRRDQNTRNANIQEIKDSFDLRQKLQYTPYTLPAREKANLIIKACVGEDDEYVYEILY